MSAKRPCRHCDSPRATRPRGLCYACYRDRAIRDLYPTNPSCRPDLECPDDGDFPDGVRPPRPCGVGVDIAIGTNNRGWGAFCRYEPPGGLQPLTPELEKDFDRCG